jgi:hypothetical protein
MGLPMRIPMKTIALTLLTAAALLSQAEALADVKPFNSGSKPASLAPHPENKHHSYGAPIQPPILSRAKTSQHKAAHKKQGAPSHGAAAH